MQKHVELFPRSILLEVVDGERLGRGGRCAGGSGRYRNVGHCRGDGDGDIHERDDGDEISILTLFLSPSTRLSGLKNPVRRRARCLLFGSAAPSPAAANHRDRQCHLPPESSPEEVVVSDEGLMILGEA